MNIKTLILLFIPLLSTAQNLTNSSNISVTKTWYQVPNGYTYPTSVHVPNTNVPQGGFPICILLHGNGGNGRGILNQFKNVLTCHALVAPSGYQGSWDICSEDSDGPDLEMVTDLVTQLQGYSNINPNKIRILGFSNGSGLANRVFIENTNNGIDIICAIVSQLHEEQFHNDSFYLPSGNTDETKPYCGYDSMSSPLTSSKYLSICNTNDPIIPYTGGVSVVGLSFLHAETAVYKIAQHKGYSGGKLNTGVLIPNSSSAAFSYLNGDVVHLSGISSHSINSVHEAYIKDFLGDCSSPTNTFEAVKQTLQLFPNPAETEITLKRVLATEGLFTVSNVLGQKVLQGSCNRVKLQIDIRELNSGIYFLKIDRQIISFIKR